MRGIFSKDRRELEVMDIACTCLDVLILLSSGKQSEFPF
jgi:hypothetical protein